MPQIDYHFRCQVSDNSPDAPLLLYMRSKQTAFDRRQMVLWALSAFWSPLACQWSESCTQEQQKAIARNAIYELHKQILYLARTFGLEQELGVPPVVYVPSNQGQTPPPVATNGSNGVANASTESTEQLHRSDDDDLLEQMFN